MVYAPSTWVYTDEEKRLADLVDEMLDVGYNAISCSTSPLSSMPDHELREAAGRLREHDVPVTLHGLAMLGRVDLPRIVELLLPQIRCITFDPILNAHPFGREYAAGALVATVREALTMTEGTQVRVGVEDFPVNADAVAHFRDDLAPVLDDPRFGILIDIGHMNVRLSSEGYYGGMTAAEHIAAIPLEIIEIHVHDNDGQSDQHGPLGSGNVDFAEVAAALRSVGFAGISTIEVVPGWHGAETHEARLEMAVEGLARWRGVWEAVGGT